jgi:hypothetical protein
MDILSNNSAKRKINKVNDIYSGNEQIEFINRHPIFKTLMKLEFEDVLRRLAKK